MALGRFVLESTNKAHFKLLSDFLTTLAESAAENPEGIIRLDTIGHSYGWHQESDVLITDAQWCKIDRSAISLCMEGNYSDMLSGVMDIASSLNSDVAVYYSITDFGNRLVVTNDAESKYYDSRILMLLSVNPKLAGVDPSLFESMQNAVGGAYRFKDEDNAEKFIFENFGFKPDTREQIAEIVELYSYQMVLDSGLKLDVDEALTNTEFMEFIVCNHSEAIVL